MPKIMASRPETPSSMNTCTVQLRNGNFCDATSISDAPFPICPRHASQIAGYSAELIADTKAGRAANAESYWNNYRRKYLDFYSAVYYIDLRNGLVKIGTTKDIKGRMRALNCDPDQLMAIERGSNRVEAKRHRQFAHLRIQGTEKFKLTNELQQHIDTCRWYRPDPYKILSMMQRGGNSDEAKGSYLEFLSEAGAI